MVAQKKKRVSNNVRRKEAVIHFLSIRLSKKHHIVVPGVPESCTYVRFVQFLDIINDVTFQTKENKSNAENYGRLVSFSHC